MTVDVVTRQFVWGTGRDTEGWWCQIGIWKRRNINQTWAVEIQIRPFNISYSIGRKVK